MAMTVKMQVDKSPSQSSQCRAIAPSAAMHRVLLHLHHRRRLEEIQISALGRTYHLPV